MDSIFGGTVRGFDDRVLLDDHEIFGKERVLALEGAAEESITIESLAQNRSYRFENFFLPFVAEMKSRLAEGSLKDLTDPKFLDDSKEFFGVFYETISGGSEVHDFPEEFDFDLMSPAGVYLWEIGFFLPSAAGNLLAKGRFWDAAISMFSLVYDMKNGWRFPPLRSAWKLADVESDLRLLATPDNELSSTQRQRKDRVIAGYRALREDPWQPFAVARTRPLEYAKRFVFDFASCHLRHCDSLLDEGRQESLDLAVQKVAIIDALIGPRPQAGPARAHLEAKTYRQLREQVRSGGTDGVLPTLVESESVFPFVEDLPKYGSGAAATRTSSLLGLGSSPYFCAPPDEAFLSLWSRLETCRRRTRNAEFLQGLAVFDTPLDPALLVQAKAAGVDIGAALDQARGAPGPLRCSASIRQAMEEISEFSGTIANLAAAKDKVDAENLALLHQDATKRLAEAQREPQLRRWQQAKENTERLLVSRRSAVHRLSWMARQIGVDLGDKVPEDLDIPDAPLTTENFPTLYNQLVEKLESDQLPKAYPELEMKPDDNPLGLLGTEHEDLNELAPNAREKRDRAARLEVSAHGLSAILGFQVDGKPVGVGFTTFADIGRILSAAASGVARSVALSAEIDDFEGAHGLKTAGYQHRLNERTLNYNLEIQNLKQIGREILQSILAAEAARLDYESANLGKTTAIEIENAMLAKQGNLDFELWRQGKLADVAETAYRRAYDRLREAERALKYEVRDKETAARAFVKPAYGSPGRFWQGAAEDMLDDARSLERRLQEHLSEVACEPHELSLLRLDPLALLRLRATGTCEFVTADWHFDCLSPGWLRTIHRAALSVHCIVGPNTNVAARLTLLDSSIRVVPPDGETHFRTGRADSRFVDIPGRNACIVTSHANRDTGTCEEERFTLYRRPFEHHGAAARWRIELPREYKHFDWMTISDVVLSLEVHEYHAPPETRVRVGKSVQDLLTRASGEKEPLGTVFSVKSAFPDAWHARTDGLRLKLTRDHFPYIASNGARVQDMKLIFLNSHVRSATDTLSIIDLVTADDLAALNDDLWNNGEHIVSVPAANIPESADLGDVLIHLPFRLT